MISNSASRSSGCSPTIPTPAKRQPRSPAAFLYALLHNRQADAGRVLTGIGDSPDAAFRLPYKLAELVLIAGITDPTHDDEAANINIEAIFELHRSLDRRMLFSEATYERRQ